MLIPLYPRGRPASEEMNSVLAKLWIVSGVDMNRSIEPPMSGDELKLGTRPSDEVLLDRFVNHARRSVRHLTESTILVMPWRARADHGLKAALTSLAAQLGFRINTGPQSYHVILIEDYEAAMDFEDYTRCDGTILGKLHQGGIWCTDYGRFFLVTWQPTVSVETLADKLKELLTTERVFPAGAKAVGEERHPCLTPPPLTGPARRLTGPIPQAAKPSRRPSSISFRAVSPERNTPTEPPGSDRNAS